MAANRKIKAAHDRHRKAAWKKSTQQRKPKRGIEDPRNAEWVADIRDQQRQLRADFLARENERAPAPAGDRPGA